MARTKPSKKLCPVCFDLIGEGTRMKIVDFLKMDIEGAEYGVLTSLEDYEIQDIDRWLIEFHENTNGEFMKIAERFKSLGFELKVHNHTDQNRLVPYEDWNTTLTGTMFAKKMFL